MPLFTRIRNGFSSTRPRALRPKRPIRRLSLEALEDRCLLTWIGFAGDPQHTGISGVPSQALDTVHWTAPVDLSPQMSGNDLLIHYGSPVVTPNNTVIFPVKTGATDGFRIEAHDGTTGALKWAVPTDYLLPPHNWVPSLGITLTPSGQVVFAGAGGTVYFINNPDTVGATTSGHLAFYGILNYSPAAFNGTVFINTPITCDNFGDIYFGFMVTGANPLGLQSGIARIDVNGGGTWISAGAAALDASMTQVVHNCAPALSNDGSILYIAVSSGTGTSSGNGYLLALNSISLANAFRTRLVDPQSGQLATLPNDGSATPTVGPDGDVYFGVLENPFTSSRGWLLHFSANLQVAKVPGAFGWDDTASVVPRSMVPAYQGASPYLLMTKYNNYAGAGGDGINRIAILDPNAVERDPRNGALVMQEVLTIAGVTPDPQFTPTHPGAVREWCINDAAVDPFTNSILANSEDGRLYRWDLATNRLVQVAALTTGIGEAYTSTVIGADGTVYAINDGILFAVGATAQGILNRRFVTHLYEDVLFREPDAIGLNGWVQALAQGVGQATIVNAVLTSLEYRARVVLGLYRYFLHREADPGGFNGFLSLLVNGATVEQLENIFVGSSEYFATRAGNNFTTFLNVMYQDGLHRNIDSAAQTFFINNQNRLSHAQMAAIVLQSHERHLQLVNFPGESSSLELQDGLIFGYYQHFLHRDADAGGWNLFTTMLDNGSTDERIMSVILESTEYYFRS